LAVEARGTATLLAALGFASGCLAVEPSPPDDTGPLLGETAAAEDTADSGDGSGASSTVGAPSRDTSPTGAEGGATSGGVTPVSVACAEDLECLAPEICCAEMTGSQCAEACADGQAAVRCDGPEDCDGKTCCWGLTGGAQCQDDAAACEGLTPDVACHTGDDCPSQNATCSPHVFVSWINLCG